MTHITDQIGLREMLMEQNFRQSEETDHYFRNFHKLDYYYHNTINYMHQHPFVRSMFLSN